jgi:hypothetical protein
MGASAKRVPALQLPNWLVRIAALRGKIKNYSNAKARRVLGRTPRSNGVSILAAAESLVRLGLLTARSS